MKLISAVSMALVMLALLAQGSQLAEYDTINLSILKQKQSSALGTRRAPGFQDYIRQLQEDNFDQPSDELTARDHARDFTLSARALSHNQSIPVTFTQPLDHFDHTTSVTFQQQFYYSLDNYIPSAKRNGEAVPVIILDCGEQACSNFLPELSDGIVDILANATGGIGVLLEHRYYGNSLPLKSDLGLGPNDYWGVDQLRWLNLRQSLEDSANFIRNLNIPGIDNKEPRKFIYYGGSYPGSRSAYMRVTYPDLVHGAIASSATVNSIDEFPEYFYPLIDYGGSDCVAALKAVVAEVDKIIAPNAALGSQQTAINETHAQQLFDLFNLKGLTNPADLANLMSEPLINYQSQTWKYDIDNTDYPGLCNDIATYGTNGVYPIHSKSAQLEAQGIRFSRQLHGYAHHMRTNYVLPCIYNSTASDVGSNVTYNEAIVKTPDECFRRNYSLLANQTDLYDGMTWMFQLCTELGYNFMAPPAHPVTGVVSGPKVVSSLMDYRFAHDEMCGPGFLPGQYFQVPDRPNVEVANDYGGLNIAYDRLAFIDGQYDAWRPGTLHSQQFADGGQRPDTVARPFKVIPQCWHMCDASGLSDPTQEPQSIQTIHQQEVAFVQAWLAED